MPTPLRSDLKREITLDGEPFVITISPSGVKMVRKGRRKGREMTWKEFWTGDAELAQQLRVSIDATAKE